MPDHLREALVEGKAAGGPEILKAADGTTKAGFDVKIGRLAIHGPAADSPTVRITATGRLAEACAANIVRGGLVRAYGRMDGGARVLASRIEIRETPVRLGAPRWRTLEGSRKTADGGKGENI